MALHFCTSYVAEAGLEFVVFVFFEQGLTLYPSWPGIYYVDQVDLKLIAIHQPQLLE